MVEINHDEILNEVLGTIRFPNQPGYQGYPRSPSYGPLRQPRDIRRVGPNVRHCNTLEGWQRDIVNRLGSGRDQYIIARPGGGKTLPIICHWTHNLLNLNTITTSGTIVSRNISGVSPLLTFFNSNARSNTPRILITVPVITLAEQTAMEIREDLSNILSQIYDNDPETCLGWLAQGSRNNLRNMLTQRQTITNALNNLVNIRNRDPMNRDVGDIPRIEEALRTINQSISVEAERTMSLLINEMVYVKTGSFKSNTDIRNALVFVTIYESAPGIINNIQNLQLLVVDEAHLIQESGNPNDDSSRAYQISGQLFEVFKSVKNLNTCRIAMLSGTINPQSAARVTEYLNRCFNRNFPTPVSAPSEAGNRSTLNIITNETISTHNGIVNSIVGSVRQNDWGQLYVLFSTNRINRIVEDCIKQLGIRDTESNVPDGYEPDNIYSGMGSERQRTGAQLNPGAKERMAIPPGMQLSVSSITNPLLRQAVMRGIGFIYRNLRDNPLENGQPLQMNNQDKLIVAKLFKERKLNVLLATDSVGIGVNIDVKDLYIPQLEKFSKEVETVVEVGLRDMAQILNRAGRGAAPRASIHTPRKNIELITTALYSGPSELPSVDIIRKIGVPCLRDYFARVYSTITNRTERIRRRFD